MAYPYGQGQYGQDASATGQQGQPGSGSAPYSAQQQMPYGGQMRKFLHLHFSVNLVINFGFVVCIYRLPAIYWYATLLIVIVKHHSKKEEGYAELFSIP